MALDVLSIPATQVRKVTEDGFHGSFEIEPLQPGVGTTLGNTLRRVLLASLEGSAITSIQIDGVAHEFTAIPHIKEDVTEMILNIKGIHLRSHLPNSKLVLDVKGPCEVLAGKIQVPTDVEIVNPELYLCTLAEGGHLHMEMTVEKGQGYVPAEKNKHDGQVVGTIPIDSVFSPIEQVNFVIEKMRVGQSTDFERLLLDVWTNGSLTPEEAISSAAQIFTRHLQIFVHFGESVSRPEVEVVAPGPQGRLNDVAIEELDLSMRAFNCLKANDINNVGALLTHKEDDLLSLRNFGKKSLDEIKDKLVEKGYVPAEEANKLFR